MGKSRYFLCALLLSACPSTEEPDARPMQVFDAFVPVIDGGIDATPGQIDASPIDAAPTAAPVISQVAWVHAAPCTPDTAGDVTITTTVTDADTAAGNLTFSGSVTGCTGTITSASSVVNCPNASPPPPGSDMYAGTVTVTDPESNSDTMTFTIVSCTNGMVP